MQVSEEYCTRHFGVVDVPPVEATVTPVSPTTVTCPAPIWITLISVPVANATLEFSGIVYVWAFALDAVTKSSLSPRTKV